MTVYLGTAFSGTPAKRCPHCTHSGTRPGIAPGWHQRKGPLPLLRAHRGLDDWQHPGWMDHAYRVRMRDGRWCYITEPYHLDGDAIADLAWLSKHGYTVWITASNAAHDPGQTVAVEITEERP